jgi:DNA polymerase IV
LTQSTTPGQVQNALGGAEGHAPCYLYLDCDRFYFAVEAAERPGLAADPRPVIIGRDPREAPRGIVTTANDAARTLGIHSGLSAAIALRLAPNALFLAPRHDLYEQYSARVMAVARAESPLVEQRSIDEAVCLWPHSFRPEPALAFRTKVLAETGISVSLGVAASPLVAKMASEAAKQRQDHVHIVRPGHEAEFLDPLPVRALVGVGPKAEARLTEAGITTIGMLAARPAEELITLFGRAYGRYLHDASRGLDDTRLEPERAAKSISAEHTFPRDTVDRHALWQQVRAQADDVAARLRAERLVAFEVAIKLRYADWQTLTRQMQLGAPTDDAALLAAGAATLIQRHWLRTRAVRLIGVRAGRLTGANRPAQLTLSYERPPERLAADEEGGDPRDSP